MALVHTAFPGESIRVRVARSAVSMVDELRDSRLGIGLGLGLSALIASPVAPIALLGPVVATIAAGRLGGRAAAAVAFVSYLAVNRPSAPEAMTAAAFAVLAGWAFPLILEKLDSRMVGVGEASAVVVDGEGFDRFDSIYGTGSAEHAFGLLRRAVEVESRDMDVVVHVEGRQLILSIDGADPSVADSIMTRIERRFSQWLSDAGYDCNLLNASQGRGRASVI